MSRKVTNEELLENLKEISDRLGRNPKIKEMTLDNGSKYSINAYKRAFGSLGKALGKIGLKRDYIPTTKEEIIKSITQLYKELDETPTLEQYFEKYPNHKYYEIKEFFGSWTKLLLKANIPVEKANKVSQQDALQALHKWYEQNNQSTSCLEYWKIRRARQRREFPYTCETIYKKFDCAPWEEIMKQIDPNYETQDPYVCRGKFLGTDGQEYLSTIERDVANVLHQLKLAGKIQTYEYERLVCPEKTWTCDFVIDGELWLEVDGMRNNRKEPYNSGQNEKIQYYQDNKINYRIVSYSDVNIKNTLIKIIGESQCHQERSIIEMK